MDRYFMQFHDQLQAVVIAETYKDALMAFCNDLLNMKYKIILEGKNHLKFSIVLRYIPIEDCISDQEFEDAFDFIQAMQRIGENSHKIEDGFEVYRAGSRLVCLGPNDDEEQKNDDNLLTRFYDAKSKEWVQGFDY